MADKKCGRCLLRHPLTSDFFGRRPGSLDGFNGICRKCVNARRNDRHALVRPQINKQQKIYRGNLTEAGREEARKRTADWYLENRSAVLLRRKSERAALRSEMLDVYGNRCVCCGEQEPAFLTLDHADNDGAAHRRETGNTYASWKDLKAKGWPQRGYRLLCYNCNCGRERNGGVCPHVGARLRFKGRRV